MIKHINKKIQRSVNFSYVLKNLPWLFAGHIISLLVSFVATILAGLFLTKDALGVYRFLFSAASLLAIPTLYGINSSLTQSSSRHKSWSFQLFAAAFRSKLRFGSLSVVLGLLFSTYYFWRGDMELFWGGLLIAFLFPLVESLNLYRSSLEALQRFKPLAVVSSLIQILGSALVALAFWLLQSPIPILAVYLVSFLILRGLVFYSVGRYLKRVSRADLSLDETNTLLAEKKAMVRYGKHLSATNALGDLAMHLDKILLFHFIGSAELAIYFFATTLPEQIKGLFKNIIPISVSRFSTRKLRDLQSHFTTRLLLLIFISLVVIALYILFAPLIFPLIFPQYLESIYYSQLFALTLVGVATYLPISILQSKRLTRRIYLLNVVTAIVQIVSLGALIYWGILGVIWARIFSRVFNLVFASILVYKK